MSAKEKLTKILTRKTKLLKDGNSWATGCDAKKKKGEEELQEINIAAADVLLQSIDTKTEESKAAFCLVEMHMDDDFAGGGIFPRLGKHFVITVMRRKHPILQICIKSVSISKCKKWSNQGSSLQVGTHAKEAQGQWHQDCGQGSLEADSGKATPRQTS